MRLDQYMVQAFSLTRNKAQQFIEAGLVSVNETVITKVSFSLVWEERIKLKEDKTIHWVSRSAGKLDGFLLQLEIDGDIIQFQWKNALDIGASTGWFTQILLERGILHVDCVDVGTNQLHEKIKMDPRVSSYEQTDIRKFQPTIQSSNHPTLYDIIVCDVSFISLGEILADLLRFSDEKTDIFLLFKPQFEVWRQNLRKTGVPRDKEIVKQKMQWFEQLLNSHWLIIKEKSPSVVIWEAWNEEWMMWVTRIEN